MTCIVGFQKDDRVYIGGDSCGSTDDGQRCTRSDVKVFQNGPILFGCSASYRGLQLLHHALDVPDYDPRDDVMKYLVVDLVDAIRECFREHGALSKSEEDGNTDESIVNALFAFQGKLYHIEGDFQIGKCYDGYDSTGCAAAYGQGVLHYFNSIEYAGPPACILKAALDAASTHNGAVAPPYVMMTQSEDGTIETL